MRFITTKSDTPFQVQCCDASYQDAWLKARDFKAKLGETLLYQTPEKTILYLGTGECAQPHDYEKVGAYIAIVTKKWPEAEITVMYDNDPTHMAYIASGIKLRDWKYDALKTKKPEKDIAHTFNFVSSDVRQSEALYKDLDTIADGHLATRLVVSMPPNLLYPDAYARIVEADLTKLGVKVTILDEHKMKELGMGAILAVGQGSMHPPRLVVLEYYGATDAAAKPLAFVGKGVTFDTGGISIKPSADMDEMRYDMAGSASVYGALKALAGRKAKVNVVGILGLAENMPSGAAYKPADIIISYSGQTIEVLNTDAEGRVVLADALWYVQKHFDPKLIVDLATLTGAMRVALGEEFAGLFSNDDTLSQQLTNAGKQVNEYLWRMPLCENFDKDIDSVFADVKNIGSNRGAGSSTAAHFLKRFVKDGMPWAHLDIASMAWDKSDQHILTGKGATGFGVRLLNAFVESVR